MSNAMAQQWVLVQDIHRIMSLCVILKTFGQKTVQLISNQLFIDDSLMIHLYSFEQRVMLKNYLNKQQKNIKCASKIEANQSLSFLDMKITSKNNRFVTSVYRKPTFSGVLTNFESFAPNMHKHGLIETFVYTSFRSCSSYEKFHRKI